MCSGKWVVCNEDCAVYSEDCAVCSKDCAVNSVQCVVCSNLCNIKCAVCCEFIVFQWAAKGLQEALEAQAGMVATFVIKGGAVNTTLSTQLH